jgi:hypothetical protein
MNGSMCGLGCQRTLRAPVNASASAGASVHQRCWAWLCSACVTKSQRRALQGWPACAACNPTPTHSTPACDAEVGQITDHGCNNHTSRPSTSAASGAVQTEPEGADTRDGTAVAHAPEMRLGIGFIGV